jgi:hypothetical protein
MYRSFAFRKSGKNALYLENANKKKGSIPDKAT